MNPKGLVVIMAGGTGGHIYPGLAVAESLLQHGVAVRWLGARGGMECRKVPVHGIEVDEIRISALRGKGASRWLSLPVRLWRAVSDALRAFDAHRPDCAVSFGGYVAGPGGLAAWLRGIPLVVHEQNRVPGLTNRVLARVAKSVLQAFPATFHPRFGAVTCGNPVRASVADLPDPEARWSGRMGPPRLLVTGGSQGARRLNQTLPAALGLLPPEHRPQVRHQAGKGNVEEVREAYRERHMDAEVVDFIDDMAGAYAWADVVVCRSGALTVSELAAAGLGAVLVPFPYAVDDHQTANARYLAERGAALLLAESELSPETLAHALSGLLSDRQQALQLARAARSAAMPAAAERVAAALLSWVPT